MGNEGVIKAEDEFVDHGGACCGMVVTTLAFEVELMKFLVRASDSPFEEGESLFGREFAKVGWIAVQ